MPEIVKVKGREILDSRGNPTVEADVLLADGTLGRAAVPSGASTGELEAIELRDGDVSRYHGKGTRIAARNIAESIEPLLIGRNVEDQESIDDAMIRLDGTPSKLKLGANAILAVSMAVARAGAAQHKEPLYRYIGGARADLLPLPLMNIVNGGVHADNSVDVQEFLIAPVGAHTFGDALRMGVEVFHTLKGILRKRGHSTAVGDEGGFAPNLKSNENALELILEAIVKSNFRPGTDVALAVDPAASEFFERDTRKYVFNKSDGSQRTSDELIEYWAEWVRQYPIISLEDGMAETDWQGWKNLSVKLGNRSN